jgi:hypothetical protein
MRILTTNVLKSSLLPLGEGLGMRDCRWKEYRRMRRRKRVVVAGRS